jgi:hypothetical protein
MLYTQAPDLLACAFKTFAVALCAADAAATASVGYPLCCMSVFTAVL